MSEFTKAHALDGDGYEHWNQARTENELRLHLFEVGFRLERVLQGKGKDDKAKMTDKDELSKETADLLILLKHFVLSFGGGENMVMNRHVGFKRPISKLCPQLDKIIARHNQFDGYFCSASANELIVKLHGKLDYGAFPLQSDAGNKNAGFSFVEFLKAHGFERYEQYPDDAHSTVELLERETKAGRFPLISVRAGKDFHILIAIPTEKGVGLFDPQFKKLLTTSREETVTRLVSETRFHVMTYTEAP